MRAVNLFLLFLTAPLIGMVLALTCIPAPFETRAQAVLIPTAGLEARLAAAEEKAARLEERAGLFHASAEEQQRAYEEQKKILAALAGKSGQQKKLSDDIYEQRILDWLGPATAVHRSSRVEIKIFPLKGIGYRGYIAKIKQYDPRAVRVVLGEGRYGGSETTAEAVARTGAIFGVNGGGFAKGTLDGRPAILPMGNTMIDGELVNDFAPSHSDLYFAGLTRTGDLVGGIYFSEKDLMRSKAYQGVSFVPILIQKGKPLPIPKKWQNQRQPRTLIGEYANGDLIFIVVDGRQADWSSGVTLEELQSKLIDFGVKDAYNLDGGGSSAFVFKGKLLNRPSDGKQRPVPTNFVVMP
ncbi:phosphodiester glycosidase family protein [Desulforudis sp. 1088]|uniref:phosphodiester glycosidase family protein n=1 Tax=unclassified Candidatus Desulforudis TaxID=2635950 RepID=UPI003CE4E72C